ncbi:MAG: deoxyribodipyrimidine photo-lyase, partial [Actinomycetota bacterium]
MGRADTTIVWFKRDLRTVDHRPLAAAAADGAVIPLYVVEPEYWAQPDQHARHWEFVRRSVEELANRLGELGAPLVVRVGDVVDVLDTLHVEHHVGRVVAHEETGTDWTYARDRRVAEWARSRRVTFEEWPTNAVVRRLSSRDDWTTIWNQRMGEPLTEEPERLR